MIAPERAMSYRKQTDTQLARATPFAPVLVSRMALGPLIQTLSLGIVNASIATEENQLDRLPQDAVIHHDALEFPDGQVVLLTRLCEGQPATVLQLPAAARAEVRENQATSEVREPLLSS